MHRGTKLEFQRESTNMLVSSFSLPYNCVIAIYETIPTVITSWKVHYDKVLLILFVILNIPKDWLTVKPHVLLQPSGNTMVLLEMMGLK